MRAVVAFGFGCVAACGCSSSSPVGPPADAQDSSAAETAPADAGDAPTESDAAVDAAPPPLVAWPRDAIFYHVYVRSFADSNGDGYGDLAGLTSKLDYVKKLGVDGVLLLPIFQDDQVATGGYATTDYDHVSSDYGGDGAFASVVDAAHQRGLKVVLDLSFTLVSESHPWFVAAKASASAPERSHFLVAGPPCPTTKGAAVANGWFPFPDGACFFSNYGSSVPNLNHFDPATNEAMIEVAEKWIGAGADGFRLDSAAEIASVDPLHPPADRDLRAPATHAFWLAFETRIKGKKPDAFSVAEVFDHTEDFYADGVDMTFDYLDWFGMFDGWTKHIKATIATTMPVQLAARVGGGLGGEFLGNHDVPGDSPVVAKNGRIADVLCPAPCTDVAPLRAAAELLFALPGTPFVYYGEEIGMHGAAKTGATKPWSRNPMQWDASAGHGFTTGTAWTSFASDGVDVASEDSVAGSMLETYRGLISVRKSSPALTHGTTRVVETSRADVFAFLREDPAERILVVASFATSDSTLTVDLGSLGIMAAKAHERIFGAMLPDVTASNASAYPITLAQASTIWIALE